MKRAGGGSCDACCSPRAAATTEDLRKGTVAVCASLFCLVVLVLCA
jgi:hypothetical protein